MGSKLELVGVWWALHKNCDGDDTLQISMTTVRPFTGIFMTRVMIDLVEGFLGYFFCDFYDKNDD